MILKRVFPVIAAIAVLCCMMIVPVSAFSTGSGYMATPLMDVDLRLNINNGDYLTIGLPPYVSTDHEEYWNCDGDIFCQLSYESFYDSVNYSVSVDASSLIGQVSFDAEPFVSVLNKDMLRSIICVNDLSGAAVTCSFDVSYVNAHGKVVTINFNEAFVANGVYSPFASLRVYDRLSELGAKGHLVLIDNFELTVDRGQASNFHFTLGFFPNDERYTVSNFLFQNGVDYGDVIYENLDGDGVLQGFADFFSNGVGSFLSAPFFGTFSLGDLLTPFIAIVLVLAVLKIFA